ncbi:MAG TPA: tRNA (adenosine(37)-N6)-threonylcarbamoyltransferase complex dimerization subunit type 1 TsaB [Mucilaginibacter sp.]|nr:tRNA (adenosine(37)-N6)-threonylcarbamoyltransferase complex dimerization subunit type 1 TsaB [Mucilaginibacter sp.]
MILQIETATSACSIALSHNGELLVCREVDQRNVHAEKITLFIDEVMAIAGIGYNDLDAVAVSCGPGSYTGLRIGVSTAKGLCFALNKPLIAVETLEAMAQGMREKEDLAANALLCPMIDARRMEVFTAVFDASGNKIRPVSADIIDAESLSDLLRDRQMIFFGDGAAKCRSVLGHNSHAVFVDDFVNSARYLTKIATEKFLSNDFADVAYFEPFYLKDFIAGKKPGKAYS